LLVFHGGGGFDQSLSFPPLFSLPFSSIRRTASGTFSPGRVRPAPRQNGWSHAKLPSAAFSLRKKPISTPLPSRPPLSVLPSVSRHISPPAHAGRFPVGFLKTPTQRVFPSLFHKGKPCPFSDVPSPFLAMDLWALNRKRKGNLSWYKLFRNFGSPSAFPLSLGHPA